MIETAALTTLKNSLAGSGTRLSPNIAKTFENSFTIGASLLNLTWEPGSLFCSNLPVLIGLVLKNFSFKGSVYSGCLNTTCRPPCLCSQSCPSPPPPRPATTPSTRTPARSWWRLPESSHGKGGGLTFYNFRVVIILLRCNFHISINQIYPIEMCTKVWYSPPPAQHTHLSPDSLHFRQETVEKTLIWSQYNFWRHKSKVTNENRLLQLQRKIICWPSKRCPREGWPRTIWVELIRTRECWPCSQSRSSSRLLSRRRTPPYHYCCLHPFYRAVDNESGCCQVLPPSWSSSCRWTELRFVATVTTGGRVKFLPTV